MLLRSQITFHLRETLPNYDNSRGRNLVFTTVRYLKSHKNARYTKNMKTNFALKHIVTKIK